MRPRLSYLSVIVLYLLMFPWKAEATNPPNKGRFPKGFWTSVRGDSLLMSYGDPGWVKKMQHRRQLRLDMALGKGLGYALQSDTFYVPVLLGQYSDSSATLPAQDFQNLLFDNNPTGTLTDYYDEVSYGQLHVTGTVYGWFTVDNGQSYYASNNHGRNSNFPQNGAGFVRDLVAKADPTVDFSQFDNDGPDGVPNSGDDDGFVDAVIAVFAGAGADWKPANDNLWPFQGSLGSNAYTTNDPSANGGMIKVNTFIVCPEEAGSGSGNNQIRPIGVFAHEFGHVLGLPDQYDRTDASEPPDYNDSEGLGEWCLMASGSWGGDGNHSEKPAHMCAWGKIQLGWLTPTILTQDRSGLTIPQVETNASAYLLWEDGYQWSRYFLLENRQKVGFDQYLNGSGLLIYHVDENRRWGRIRWSSGPVNDDETHKLIDLEEADGRADLDNNINRGDAGDPFPGTTNNRAFTDATTPNSRDYDGNPTGVAVTNISDSGPTITADVKVRMPLGYALVYDENGITGWGWGFQNPADSWGGVRFTATKAGTLAALDVGFRASSTDYEIKVYDRLAGSTPQNLLATVSGHADAAGWYTIPIPSNTVALGDNDDFFVSLKIANKAFAISYDPYGPKSMRSYWSPDGVTFDNSISTNSSGGDINIRARIRTQTTTAVADRASGGPYRFDLRQNYPNPFNPGTEIRYELPAAGKVVLEVYNLLGQRVTTLVDEPQAAGDHAVHFEPRNLPSGMYIYRLKAGRYIESRKMLLLR